MEVGQFLPVVRPGSAESWQYFKPVKTKYFTVLFLLSANIRTG